MRPISLITAGLVSAFLFFLVIEREALLGIAGASEGDAATEITPEVEAASKPVHKVKVVALKSTAQNIENAVLLRGQTEAARQLEVRSETNGLVISEPIRKGAFVEEGTLLCEIDPGTRAADKTDADAILLRAQAGVPEAEARVAEAEARLNEAEINDRAARRLSEGGFASETRVASARAALESAHAAVESANASLSAAYSSIKSAEARVASAEKELERLNIKAPFSGLLETDTAELGSLLQPGSACATIVQLDPIKLVGFVPETEVDKIQLSANAMARLASGREVGGQVSFLSRSADPTTRTFRVEVTVPNKDLSIRDGQTVEIVVASEGSLAHLLPQSALTLNDHGDLGVRLVGDDDIVVFNEVQLLRDGVDGVWLAGLPDEASVITSGQEFVTDGVHVEVTFKEAAQ
ncbi:efflux RND transporter periplasmic adaptor subunit [Halocynthiibacter sp. C4]|uniref:efflux RND transporter periplasmic adaptor subunit n=1 Tax=Halocynthiibacter sp. C4 TaxID=2992758 RepID=UPI00237BFBC8|nr:efflux RND transporter periplasmic adaptor subunit [Halocynthiibacter sp. C4]MDE0589937.1 efflux RND transporter periplasmic adaptor subunit [Halocynthiibacter sp. C4]